MLRMVFFIQTCFKKNYLLSRVTNLWSSWRQGGARNGISLVKMLSLSKASKQLCDNLIKQPG